MKLFKKKGKKKNKVMKLVKPAKQLKLQFDGKYGSEEPQYSDPVDKPVTKQLSAAVFTDGDRYLWLAADEEMAIERLEKGDDKTYQKHERFALKDLLDGFDPGEKEVDIEGLDFDGQYLWLIGSHSSKRKKANKNPLGEKALRVDREGNRYLLARIPLVNGKLVKSTDSTHSAVLRRANQTDELMQVLASDPYLEKILSIDLPGKDNGFDIEGFVIQNNKVLLGLRGPVLRGIAILVEIELEEESAGILTLKSIESDGKRYKLHFLNLEGLGIRELCFAENHLLILAGPTMDLDASLKLFRLDDPFNLPDRSFNESVERLFEIPHEPRSDKAEGIALYPNAEEKLLLVVYDTPNSQRLSDDNLTVLADLFPLKKIE